MLEVSSFLCGKNLCNIFADLIVKKINEVSPDAKTHNCYYGAEFMPPRTLGRINAQRFRDELILDNLSMCRFHRLWAEEMLPDVIGSLYGQKEAFLDRLANTASRDQ